MKIMITAEGPHPAYKWADVILDDLIQLNDSAPPDQLAAGNALRRAIADAIIPLIEDAQAAERERRHNMECHCDPHVEQIMQVIKAHADQSMFAGHFDQAHVQDRIRVACSRHVRTAMHIENLHAADKENAPPADPPPSE